MPTITLPLPPDSLRVNASTGQKWIMNRKAKQDYELAARRPIQDQRWQWYGIHCNWPVQLTITAYLGLTAKGRPQLVDTSDIGTWGKLALDLLVRAGAFPDDNAKRINPVLLVVKWDAADPRLVFEWAGIDVPGGFRVS